MPRAARWGLTAGSELGRYQILKGIARGGMGEVYLARMFVGGGDAHKLVAIKRILPHYLDDDALREMFHKEGKLALLLDHPHVVQIFDLAEIDGEHIIAMEYIHGHSGASSSGTPQVAACSRCTWRWRSWSGSPRRCTTSTSGATRTGASSGSCTATSRPRT